MFPYISVCVCSNLSTYLSKLGFECTAYVSQLFLFTYIRLTAIHI